jgi:predicted nucleic acid-binding protein
MAVVDSSALIPLARVGRLDLVAAVFEDVATTAPVESEVIVDGKPGTAALREFFEDVRVDEAPDDAASVAEADGIAVADASVILCARSRDAPLLANDRGLITVARSHGVDCWWVTTLLLKATATGVLDSDEATDALYDLVDAGMNLDPQVYAQVQRKLADLGE